MVAQPKYDDFRSPKMILIRRLLIVGLASFIGASSPSADVLEQILVKVNGEIFTKTDLEQRQFAHLRREDPGLSLEDIERNETLQQTLGKITPRILVEAVNELLVVQQGKALGYQMTDEQFEDIIGNIKKENEIETDEQFQTALDQESMTLAGLRRSLERQMLVSRVQQLEVLSKLNVNEAEQREYYEKHIDEFVMPPEVTIRELLISVPGEDTGTWENQSGESHSATRMDRARLRAEAARKRILEGESFSTVVTELSDAPSKANGGLIGPVNPDELLPMLRSIVMDIQVGEISEIVQTERGYQFFKLESSSFDTHRAFEEIQPEISRRVYAEKGDDAYKRLIERLRSEAIVDWKNKDLEKIYLEELQGAELVSST
jgi:peptidyl-prolyl cis-trans isomerase SurA